MARVLGPQISAVPRAQGLRLLLELTGAHRWVHARQFNLPIGLTFSLGVRYLEALSLTVL